MHILAGMRRRAMLVQTAFNTLRQRLLHERASVPEQHVRMPGRSNPGVHSPRSKLRVSLQSSHQRIRRDHGRPAPHTARQDVRNFSVRLRHVLRARPNRHNIRRQPALHYALRGTKRNRLDQLCRVIYNDNGRRHCELPTWRISES